MLDADTGRVRKWHNGLKWPTGPSITTRAAPRAVKRCTLLKDNGITPKVVEYLKDVPTRKELELLVMQLGIPAAELVRKNEALYKEKYKGLELNEHEWVRVMHENPKLIERPVVRERTQSRDRPTDGKRQGPAAIGVRTMHASSQAGQHGPWQRAARARDLAPQ